MSEQTMSNTEQVEEILALRQRIRDLEQAAAERKFTDLAGRESGGLYRSLFEHMLNGFAYCRMLFEQGKPQDFIYLSVNSAFESLTGLKNVVGKKVSEVIPGICASDTGLFEIYGRVALTGKPETFELYVEALKMWFLVSVYSPEKEFFVALFDVITERKLAQEALQRAHDVLEQRVVQRTEEWRLVNEELRKEITEHKQAKAVLKETERQFRNLAEQSLIGVCIVQDGIFKYVNAKYADIHGYTVDELLDDFPSLNLMHPDYRQGAYERRMKRFAGELLDEPNEIKKIKKNGEIIDVETYGTIESFQGKPARFGFTLDITERKLANEALRESEERYRSLASTVDLLLLVDRNSQYLFANENYLAYYRPKRDSVIGRKYADLHGEEASIIFADAVKCVFETGNAYQDEWHGTMSRRYWLRTFSPVKNAAGNITAVLVAAKDIHDRKLAEEKVRVSLKEKELLLREVHHRVKNNMQVISSLLNLQASSKGTPEMMEMFHKSQRRIQSMALVHAQLYESKDFARINLAGYARALSQELMQSYALHPASIDLLIQADDVYTDINKAIPCGLILNELISNALKHAFAAEESGQLRIMVGETENREIEIVVRDNGLGLPDDFASRQPRGIGLYLVNGLVKNQLGGQMEVIQDHGTEFRIKFPAGLAGEGKRDLHGFKSVIE